MKLIYFKNLCNSLKFLLELADILNVNLQQGCTMDVSRIDAYKPQIYDWRNMTAKEIIKHDDDGDKVPAMYLQWAREFLNSIYSDDVTTYEIAKSGKNKSNEGDMKPGRAKARASVVEGSGNTEEPEGTGEPEEGEKPEEQEPKLSKAQQVRKNMQDEGVSIFKQGKYFRGISQSLTSDVFSSLIILKALEDSSNKETIKSILLVNALESRMESYNNNLRLLKDASKVNESNENNDAVIQRALETGQKLNQEALKAHGNISNSESELFSIGTDMDGYLPLYNDAVDFGEQTIEIGREIPFLIEMLGFKSSVINSGSRAVDQGVKGLNTNASAQVLNNNNLDTASNLHNYIAEKSGVEAPQKNNNQKNGNEDDDSKKFTTENIDENKKEDIKKEDKDLPTDRETLVKLEDEDKITKGEIVKNASKMTTIEDAPSNSEFADDEQRNQTANEFEHAKSNDGADERTVTMALRADSINADNSAVESIGSAQNISQMSQNAYSELDQNIQELMNEINSTQEEIKNEIRAMNLGGNSDGISRINQLNEELRGYGISALSMVGSTEGIINSYAGELDNIGEIFNNAVSKGGLAVSGGEALIANSQDRWMAFKLVNDIIGTNTINVGSRTTQDGIKGIGEKTKASSTVNSNLLSIASMKSEIQSKTGVEGGASARKNVKTVNNDEVKNDIIPQENRIQNIAKPNLEKPKANIKESEKAVKVAQNDGTDTDDKQNTDINAIIARKVRRGEVNMG